MTRLPGFELQSSLEKLDVDNEYPWLFELKECVTAMRQWISPFDQHICSAVRTPIRSVRVPKRIMGPFSSENDLNDFLIRPATHYLLKTSHEFDEARVIANEIREISHRVTFTHGDLAIHNILVGRDGHLSGILDWESAGWLPEYWEFTTAMRFIRTSWWGQIVLWMGGKDYDREVKCEKALQSLTIGSYVGI